MNSINIITKCFLNINQVVKEKSSIKTLKKFAEGVKEKVPAPVTEEEATADKENQENMETTEGEETTPNAGQSGTWTEAQTPSLQLAPPPPQKKNLLFIGSKFSKWNASDMNFITRFAKEKNLIFLF